MEKIELQKNCSSLTYSSAHLVQITRGSASLTMSSGSKAITAPALILVPPMRQERIELRGLNQSLGYPSSIFLQALNSLESSMHIQRTAVYASIISNEDCTFAASLLQKAQTILETDKKTSEMADFSAYRETESNILHIICLCILLIRRNTVEGLELKPVWTINDAISYIDRNFCQPFSLEYFTNRCALNSSSFSRLFKQATGCTLFEYINRIRIRQACYLLKRSRRSILEIAISLGYNNVSFFNRYFRRITGSSPTEYRQNSK